jgi:lipoprotein-releasing system permease protein
MNFDSNRSFETVPINKYQLSQPLLNKIKGIKHSQVFITKSGIIKTNNNIQAIILKGVDSEFDWSFIKKSLVRGEIFTVNDSVKTNKIIISEFISKLLNISIGDKIPVYFVQNPPRVRKFTVCGIYKTSIEDFDKTFAIVDIKHLQKLNGWNKNQVSGYEIIIDDFDNLKNLTDSVYDLAGFQFTEDGSTLKVENIKQQYPQIFDWLNLQNINVWIILALMLVVAGFNMISGLLILILERTNTIGILKALGYNSWKIRKIFLYQSGFLIAKGLFWGNIIGISLCLLQKHFSIIPLDETTYYINTVPINLQLLHIIYLNIGTLLLTLAMMIIPSFLISKISPAKAIKFN